MNPQVTLLAQMLRGQGAWPPGHAAGPFLALADLHGVSALLHQAVEAAPPAGMPEAVRAALRDRALRAAGVELACRHELQRLLDLMDGAGVRPLLLKGTALAYSLYPAPALRERADTDLLVPPAQRARLSALLEAQGYLPREGVGGDIASAEISYWKDGSPLVLDVHWRVKSSVLLGQALASDDLDSGAAAVPGLGPHARAPGAVDAVLLAALHRAGHHQSPYYTDGVAHRGDRLIWLYDLHLLVPRLTAAQAAELARRAARHRVAGLVLDALRATGAAFGTALPPALIEALARAASQAEPSMVFLRGGRRRLLLAELRAVHGWPARWQLLREHALPPADYMLRKYETRRRWLLPALYVRRALGWLTR